MSSLYGVTSLDVLLMVLASYRLTHFLVFDKLAEPIRQYFFVTVPGAGHDEETVPRRSGVRRFIGRGLSCFWCTGVWISAFVLGVFTLAPSWFAYGLIGVFAIAGGQSLLEKWVQRQN